MARASKDEGEIRKGLSTELEGSHAVQEGVKTVKRLRVRMNAYEKELQHKMTSLINDRKSFAQYFELEKRKIEKQMNELKCAKSLSRERIVRKVADMEKVAKKNKLYHLRKRDDTCPIPNIMLIRPSISDSDGYLKKIESLDLGSKEELRPASSLYIDEYDDMFFNGELLPRYVRVNTQKTKSEQNLLQAGQDANHEILSPCDSPSEDASQPSSIFLTQFYKLRRTFSVGNLKYGRSSTQSLLPKRPRSTSPSSRMNHQVQLNISYNRSRDHSPSSESDVELSQSDAKIGSDSRSSRPSKPITIQGNSSNLTRSLSSSSALSMSPTSSLSPVSSPGTKRRLTLARNFPTMPSDTTGPIKIPHPPIDRKDSNQSSPYGSPKSPNILGSSSSLNIGFGSDGVYPVDAEGNLTLRLPSEEELDFLRRALSEEKTIRGPVPPIRTRAISLGSSCPSQTMRNDLLRARAKAVAKKLSLGLQNNPQVNITRADSTESIEVFQLDDDFHLQPISRQRSATYSGPELNHY